MTYDPMRPTPSSTPNDPSGPGTDGSPWARPGDPGASSTGSANLVPADSSPTQPVQTGAYGTGPGAVQGTLPPAGQPVGYPAQQQPVQSIAPAPKRRSSGGRWLNGILAIAAAVAIGGVAFAIGRGTASASTTGNPNRTGAITNGNGNGRPFGSFAPGQGGGFRGGFGGGAAGVTITGTVESVDGNTITIKTANGQTVTLNTSTDTTYHTQAPANASDVTSGKTVQVQVGFAGGFGGGFGGGGNGGNGGGNGGNGGNGGGNGGANGPTASGAPAGPVGTANSITVVP